MAFLEDFVGRGMAKTNNGLLLTEVAASGTSLKTFASATVIAVNELEAIPYNEALSNYLDDTRSVAWVMQRAVHGEIVLLGSTSIRYYEATPTGAGVGVPSLLGFPVHYSAKSGATAASAKSVYFGNWNYVGVREGPGFTMMRDPYTRSSYGEVILNYFYRIVYKVLVAEAIGYGVHPSA
jgi:HK97 family phage major capsid protein